MILSQVLIKYKNNERDVEKVVNELEGKHFCEKMEPMENTFTLRVYLTNNCNLRCSHCFMYADHCLENELTYEEIIELLKESREANCEKVIFTGGEVLLKDHFIDILKYSKKIGLYVQVLTNGVLWNTDMIKEASDYIDEVQVSIDGFDEKTNAAIRGKGTFEKALTTVEDFLKEKKSFVSVITTPTYDFIEKYKNEYINFGREMVSRFGTEQFLVIFGKELLDGRRIKSDPKKNSQMTKIVDEIYEAIYPNSELTTFVVNHKNNRIYMNCGYGGLTINSNGDFYFCGRIMEVGCYGNVRNMNFQDIMKLRKTAREKTYVSNITPCKNCDIRFICGGGCRVSNIPEITRGCLDQNREYQRACDQSYKDNLYIGRWHTAFTCQQQY